MKKHAKPLAHIGSVRLSMQDQIKQIIANSVKPPEELSFTVKISRTGEAVDYANKDAVLAYSIGNPFKHVRADYTKEGAVEAMIHSTIGGGSTTADLSILSCSLNASWFGLKTMLAQNTLVVTSMTMQASNSDQYSQPMDYYVGGYKKGAQPISLGDFIVQQKSDNSTNENKIMKIKDFQFLLSDTRDLVVYVKNGIDLTITFNGVVLNGSY